MLSGCQWRERLIMNDFNKLHQLATELEEFSSKATNKIKANTPVVKSKAEILSSINSKLTFAKTERVGLTKINKKSWPASPSVQFFSSPEVLNKESSFKLNKMNLNAQTLIHNTQDPAVFKTQKTNPPLNKNGIKKNNNPDSIITNPDLLNTLQDIGFISAQESLLKEVATTAAPETATPKTKAVKTSEGATSEININNTEQKNLVYVENAEKTLDLGPIVKSQAFNCLHKELSFSVAAFSLDLVLNFSLFVCINAIYKSFYLESLLHFSTFKFIFAFSVIFQVSVFLQRCIFKQTFGEWYNNIQIGTGEQQKDSWFILSLFWKSFITLFTGVLPLSVASVLINKDLSYYLTDLQTFKKLDN